MPTGIYERKPHQGFQKGHIGYGKGKKRPLTKEWIENIRKSMIGRPSSKKGKKYPQFSGENHPMWGKHHSEKIRKKISEKHKGLHSSPATEFKKGQTAGSKNAQWKNGKYKDANGYILILSPNHPFRINGKEGRGYVLEHRLVAEKYLGRYLLPEETCHHINEIKNDNRLENLMVFVSKSAHIKFHRNPANVKLNEIVFDGRKL